MEPVSNEPPQASIIQACSWTTHQVDVGTGLILGYVGKTPAGDLVHVTERPFQDWPAHGMVLAVDRSLSAQLEERGLELALREARKGVTLREQPECPMCPDWLAMPSGSLRLDHVKALKEIFGTSLSWNCSRCGWWTPRKRGLTEDERAEIVALHEDDYPAGHVLTYDDMNEEETFDGSA